MKSPSIVIFDTEYTAWANSKAARYGYPHQHRELIQIAARRWTWGTDWQEGETFYANIKPQVNPTLSGFIQKLTGVTQAQVNRADSAKDVLKAFAKFAVKSPCYSNGNDINVIAETAGHQHFVMPLDSRRFISLRPKLRQKIERLIGPFDHQAYPSGRLYELFDIRLPKGRAHNALHDVNSLCATISHLQHSGINMKYLWLAK